ncbi:MAG: hypothetical protein V6Z89_20800 [Desulfobacter sp.]
MKTQTVIESTQTINNVFLQNGFIVLAPEYTDLVYQEIELAGMIDTDIDAIADIALNYKADFIVTYNINLIPKKGGESQYFGGFNLAIQMKVISPASGDVVSVKKGQLYVQIPKNAKIGLNSLQVVKASTKVASAISQRVAKDTLSFLSGPVRFDTWLRDFSQEDIFTFMEIVDRLKNVERTIVRNQAPENFQVDVFYKGKKFDLQRVIYNELKKRDIFITIQQAKGNRLLLVRN